MAPRKPSSIRNPSRGSGLRTGGHSWQPSSQVLPCYNRGCTRGSRGVHEIRREREERGNKSERARERHGDNHPEECPLRSHHMAILHSLKHTHTHVDSLFLSAYQRPCQQGMGFCCLTMKNRRENFILVSLPPCYFGFVVGECACFVEFYSSPTCSGGFLIFLRVE